MKKIFVVGLNYKTAPLAIRERFAIAVADRIDMAVRMRRQHMLSESVILWTCNRVEVYGVSDEGLPNPEALMRCLVDTSLPRGSQLYCHQGAAAVRHLFSVSSGMDSMVLGETEITGQVKNAYETAHQAGFTGKRLNKLFQKAFETAKEIRATTAIGSGNASVGSVAVQHAQKIFGASLKQRNVMVIGAGNMAEKCLRHLAKQGVESITIVNRSVDKAESLVSVFGGTAMPFGRCLSAMMDMDIVIVSTGCPEIIIDRSDVESVMSRRVDRPLVIIDIAVPRNVAPEVHTLPGVHLHNIGDLEETVRENIGYREQEMDMCWAIVEVKLAEFAARIDVMMNPMNVDKSHEVKEPA